MPVLASSAYRRLWAARTVSQWGDIAQFTALALLVFHLTRSGLGVSGVVIAEIVPVLLLAPLAGALVDPAAIWGRSRGRWCGTGKARSAGGGPGSPS